MPVWRYFELSESSPQRNQRQHGPTTSAVLSAPVDLVKKPNNGCEDPRAVLAEPGPVYVPGFGYETAIIEANYHS